MDSVKELRKAYARIVEMIERLEAEKSKTSDSKVAFRLGKEIRELTSVSVVIAEKLFDMEKVERFGLLKPEEIEEKKREVFGEWLEKRKESEVKVES
jgi:uncharacterized protein (UPF0335 family)